MFNKATSGIQRIGFRKACRQQTLDRMSVTHDLLPWELATNQNGSSVISQVFGTVRTVANERSNVATRSLHVCI